MNVNQSIFEQRLVVLRHIAARYPCWVGRNELSRVMSGTSRTQQRTLKELVEAGADALVAGSYIFGSENPTETIAKMKRL